MKKTFVTATLLLMLVNIFTSCSKSGGYDGGTGGGGNGGGGGGDCSGTPGPLFTTVRSIIRTNCAISGCHTGSNAQNGINFSNDCVIVSQKARIKVRAVDGAGTPTQMPPPPNPPLSTSDRTAITNWINAGGRITD
ncbi:MAG: hypothetical protein ICV66_11525 [Chitinophagaceae bacterium]|nr:hypothetical protein [Chitinophagaceae bacterium]